MTLSGYSVGFTAKRLQDSAPDFNPGFTPLVTVHPEGVIGDWWVVIHVVGFLTGRIGLIRPIRHICLRADHDPATAARQIRQAAEAAPLGFPGPYDETLLFV